jgi:hypothetical protein
MYLKRIYIAEKQIKQKTGTNQFMKPVSKDELVF